LGEGGGAASAVPGTENPLCRPPPSPRPSPAQAGEGEAKGSGYAHSLPRRALLATPALLLALPARAIEPPRFELTGVITPGGLVRGQALPLSRISFNGRPLRVSPEGRFVFGLGRDANNVAVLDILHGNARPETRRLEVTPRTYAEQRISGLPGAMVTPPPETLERIRREQAQLNAARAQDRAATDWWEGLSWPCRGPISGVFGSRRVLNGEPRAPHLGLDIAAPAGTPVLAGAAGVVRLAEPDMYFSGGSVLVDHGHTVMSFYIHMSRVEVKAGDRVERGAMVGAVGATGRVTGAHLHLALFWAGVALDPALALPASQE
jgi:murein DD-endopeptidase MepM/ murein hydrolase activator NlpD